MYGMINGILNIEQIEAGKYLINKENFDIRESVKEGFLLVRPVANKRNIALRLSLPEHVPTMFADRRAVAQILINLLSNAVKFSNEGGDVNAMVDHHDGKHIIKIIDHGVGISKENLGTVALPFSRHEPDPHKAYDGIGLGLSIAKSLVELHAGELLIKSELGKGTTVSVILPEIV